MLPQETIDALNTALETGYVVSAHDDEQRQGNWCAHALERKEPAVMLTPTGETARVLLFYLDFAPADTEYVKGLLSLIEEFTCGEFSLWSAGNHLVIEDLPMPEGHELARRLSRYLRKVRTVNNWRTEDGRRTDHDASIN